MTGASPSTESVLRARSMSRFHRNLMASARLRNRFRWLMRALVSLRRLHSQIKNTVHPFFRRSAWLRTSRAELRSSLLFQNSVLVAGYCRPFGQS